MLASLLLLLAACGGGGGSGNPSVTLDRIEVVAPSASLAKGAAVSLTVVGHFSNGNSTELTSVNWASSDPAVAVVDAQGTVLSVDVGTVTVTATLSGSKPLNGEITLTVTDPALLAITVEPPSASVAIGVETTFTASGRFTDGSSSDISSQVAWSVADTAVAEIVATGRAAGVSLGNTTIIANLDGQSGSAVLMVTDAALQNIQVTPAQLSLPQGMSQELTATGLYSDGSSVDLNAQTVQWETADDAIASVDASGLLTGNTPGSTTVSATFGVIIGTTTLQVTAATLQEIVIMPASPALAVGSDLALMATGLFSDDTRRDLSSEVSWSVTDPVVATVQAGDNESRLAGLAAGQTVLRATLGSVTGSTPVQVKSSTLTAIRVTPSDFRVAVGRRVQLKATGDFSDGASQPLDTQVDWDSTDAAIASVDTQGRVTTRAPGSAWISARQGNIVGSVLVTVTDASLQSLEIMPVNPKLAQGTSRILEAHGQYDDGSNPDLSDEVVWQSGDPLIARIDNDDANRGRLMALAPGTTTITTTLGGVSAQTTVTVSDATITEIELAIAPPATATLLRGRELSLTATATFDNGTTITTQDVTQQAVWRLSDNNKASVSNVLGSIGRVTGLAAGNVTVSASLLGQTGSTDLSVEEDPLAPVSLTVAAAPNVIFNNGSDGTVLSITVLAVDAASTVPDTTSIDLEIIKGNATLSAPNVTTNNGAASVNLTSTTPGLVVVRATIAGATVANDVPVRVMSNFENTLGLAAFANTDINNGQLAAGAQFGVFVSNLSNRTFSIDEFRFLYDTTVVLRITDPNLLNGNILEGGGQTGFIVRTSGNVPVADLTSVYSFSDAPTGESFEGGVLFRLGDE
jgi:hypothetical protein